MIRAADGTDVLADWAERRCAVRAEFSSGNVAVWFTGIVGHHSTVEVILSRDEDEMSVSLFCATWRVFDPSSGEFPRVVVVTTDANTVCTLYEVRPPLAG